MTAVTTLPNIGPAMAAELARAGITTLEQLRELGGDAAYARMIRSGTRPHFITYYVLHMALQGRPWNDCKGAEKDAFRVTFDQIKASAGPANDAGIEKILNEIGVGMRR